MRCPRGQTWPWLVLLAGLPRTRTARPSCTKIWIAHHCVQPWQVLATQSPLAGAVSFDLRTAIALETGSVVAHPAASKVAVAAEAWMNVRLVSLIRKSPSPLSAPNCIQLLDTIRRSWLGRFDAAQHPRGFCLEVGVGVSRLPAIVPTCAGWDSPLV